MNKTSIDDQAVFKSKVVILYSFLKISIAILSGCGTI